MKKYFVLFLVLCVLIGCATQKVLLSRMLLIRGKIAVSTQGIPEIHKADIVIAIIPFKNNSSDTSMDKMSITLSDLICAKMSSSKGFKLVERNRMDDMLKEIKLGYSGIIDANTAIQLGKMLGANVMVFGSFSVFEGKVLLTIRLVKVETGENNRWCCRTKRTMFLTWTHW